MDSFILDITFFKDTFASQHRLHHYRYSTSMISWLSLVLLFACVATAWGDAAPINSVALKIINQAGAPVCFNCFFYSTPPVCIIVL